jgi:hypothetical protein
LLRSWWSILLSHGFLLCGMGRCLRKGGVRLAVEWAI